MTRPVLLGYIRVSTDDQARRGTSLEGQREQLMSYAESVGASIEIFADQAVSGAAPRREGLDALRARLLRGGAEAVVVTRLDRLARDMVVYSTFLELCAGVGVVVRSLGDGLDTGSEAGEMAGGVTALFAAAERRRIATRTKEGRANRAREGAFVGGTAPFGYRRVPRLTESGTQRGWKLVVDEQQAQTIRAMYYHLILQCASFADTARTLNAAGLLTASGAPWTSSTLARWARRPEPLRNAAGTWVFGKIQVPIPPILRPSEVARWRLWQSGEAPRPLTQRGPYLLSGILHYPCGRAAMGRATDRRPPKYVCAGRYGVAERGDDLDHSECRPVDLKVVDRAVVDALQVALTNPRVLAAATRARTGAKTTSLAELEDKLARFDSQVAEQLREMRVAGLDRAALRMLASDAAAERRALKTDIGAEAHRTAGTDPKVVAALGDELRRGLLSTDPALWARVLAAVGARVTVTGYRLCETCGGSHRLPFEPGGGRRAPTMCSDCPTDGRWLELLVEIDDVVTQSVSQDLRRRDGRGTAR